MPVAFEQYICPVCNSWECLVSLKPVTGRVRVWYPTQVGLDGNLKSSCGVKTRHTKPWWIAATATDFFIHLSLDLFLSRLIDLEIPTLPKGRQLVINIRNTWGDRHYVGLNGIEVFTECGKPAEIAEVSRVVVRLFCNVLHKTLIILFEKSQ